jgi:MFS family permease
VRGGVQAKVIATAGVGGVLAYTVGAFLISLNWRYSYFALGILYLVAFALRFFLIPEPKLTPEQQAAKGAEPKVMISEGWKSWNTPILAVALLFNNLVGVALISWLPSVLSVNMHVSPHTELDLIMIGNSVVMGVATAYAGTLVSARFVGREKIFMLVCSVLSALLLVVFISSRSVTLTVIPLYLITLLTMFAFIAILTLPYRLVAPRIIGSSFTVINIGAFVGCILQGQIVGRLATMAGGSFTSAFIILAVAITLAGIVPYLSREPKAAEAARATPATHQDRGLLTHVSSR